MSYESHALGRIESLALRAEQAERERDEARAEVERLRLSFEHHVHELLRATSSKTTENARAYVREHHASYQDAAEHHVKKAMEQRRELGGLRSGIGYLRDDYLIAKERGDEARALLREIAAVWPHVKRAANAANLDVQVQALEVMDKLEPYAND